MGYFTHHNLDIKCDHTKHNALEIIEKFRKEYEEAGWALDEDGSCADSSKWYEAEKELREFSKQYPEVLFTLHGEGAEAGDVWNLYAMDGKVQMEKAVLIIAEFDEAKLQ